MEGWKSPCCEEGTDVFNRHYVITAALVSTPALLWLFQWPCWEPNSVAFVVTKWHFLKLDLELPDVCLIQERVGWSSDWPRLGVPVSELSVKHTLPCISCSQMWTAEFSSRQTWMRSSLGISRSYRPQSTQFRVSLIPCQPPGAICPCPSGATALLCWARAAPGVPGVLPLPGAVGSVQAARLCPAAPALSREMSAMAAPHWLLSAPLPAHTGFS